MIILIVDRLPVVIDCMHQEARTNMTAVLTHRCDEKQWPVRCLCVSVVITV